MACATVLVGSRKRSQPAATRFFPSTKSPRSRNSQTAKRSRVRSSAFCGPRRQHNVLPDESTWLLPCYFGAAASRGYNGWMPNSRRSTQMHGTTVLCVRKDNKVVLIADGQVTMGDHVMKHTARKTRRLYNDKVVAGFAGSTADAITLFERFEGKLQEFSGNLQKASVELAKEWRKDRALRHLEAL